MSDAKCGQCQYAWSVQNLETPVPSETSERITVASFTSKTAMTEQSLVGVPKASDGPPPVLHRYCTTPDKRIQFWRSV